MLQACSRRRAWSSKVDWGTKLPATISRSPASQYTRATRGCPDLRSSSCWNDTDCGPCSSKRTATGSAARRSAAMRSRIAEVSSGLSIFVEMRRRQLVTDSNSIPGSGWDRTARQAPPAFNVNVVRFHGIRGRASMALHSRAELGNETELVGLAILRKLTFSNCGLPLADHSRGAASHDL